MLGSYTTHWHEFQDRATERSCDHEPGAESSISPRIFGEPGLGAGGLPAVGGGALGTPLCERNDETGMLCGDPFLGGLDDQL
jgi:hypothetical protein